MSDRPTPETDAQSVRPWMDLQNMTTFARHLERQRDDARETLSDVCRAIGARKNEGIRLAAMRVKAERDEALEQAAQLREKYRVHHDEAERITAEIFEVRKQRDMLAESLRNLKAEYDDRKNQFGESPLWTKHEDVDVIKDCHAMIAAVEAVQMSNRPTPETDAFFRPVPGAGNGRVIGKIPDFCRLLERQRDEAREQRDRLAEACQKLMKVIGPPNATIEQCWAGVDEIDEAWEAGKSALDAVDGGGK